MSRASDGGESQNTRETVLFYSEGWGGGGIESLVMDLVKSRAFAETGLAFEIFNVCDWDDRHDADIAALGGIRRVVFPDSRPNIFKRFAKGSIAFNRVLRENDYRIVHVNATNGLNFSYVFLAKLHGVPVRVMHSHNSAFNDERSHHIVKQVGHILGRVLFSRCATVCIACSEQAAKFLFPRREYTVVPNGIDVQRFSFSAEARQRIREELGFADDEVVVGSVGHVIPRKNPLYQIEVFERFTKLVPNSRFVMVGNGDMLEDTQLLVEKLGLTERVAFVPATSKPEDYYAAMDALLMPSATEGFGLVAIEAQCCGLPVLASSALPAATVVTDCMRLEPLDSGSGRWASLLADMLNNGDEAGRDSAWEALEGTDFDNRSSSSKIVGCWE